MDRWSTEDFGGRSGWWHVSEERASENALKEKRCLSIQSRGYVSLAGAAEVRLGLVLQVEGSHRRGVKVCDGVMRAGNSKFT